MACFRSVLTANLSGHINLYHLYPDLLSASQPLLTTHPLRPTAIPENHNFAKAVWNWGNRPSESPKDHHFQWFIQWKVTELLFGRIVNAWWFTLAMGHVGLLESPGWIGHWICLDTSRLLNLSWDFKRISTIEVTRKSLGFATSRRKTSWLYVLQSHLSSISFAAFIKGVMVAVSRKQKESQGLCLKGY